MVGRYCTFHVPRVACVISSCSVAHDVLMYAQLPLPPPLQNKGQKEVCQRFPLSHLVPEVTRLQSLVIHIGRHQSDKAVLHQDLILPHTTISGLGTPNALPLTSL